jgi:hypothetical protein
MRQGAAIDAVTDLGLHIVGLHERQDLPDLERSVLFCALGAILRTLSLLFSFACVYL